MTLTQQRLKELYSYDQHTGVFTRRVAVGRHGRYRAGESQLSVRANGYIDLGIDYKRYRAHRAAWLYMTGEWPADQIDHIDGNRTNNAFANLRLANNAENSQNETKPRANNKSGFLGVVEERAGSKWRAYIKLNGKTRDLGRFDSPEKAHARYREEKRKIHPYSTL